MPELKQRNTNNKSSDNNNKSIPIKPLSTSKFKDNSNGLNYNYEDRLSKLKIFKTSILMILFTLISGYFLYQFYIWFSNIIFDIYWHHLRGVRNLENPNFIRQIWLSNLKDLFYILIKIYLSYQLFKFINKKLLLTNDDLDELEIYN